MKLYLTKDCIDWLGDNQAYFRLSGETLYVYKENPVFDRQVYNCYVYPNYSEFPDFCYIGQTYSTNQVVSADFTNEFIARPDNYKICSVLFVIVIFAIFLINIITSFVRRGGVLGGLL